MKRIINNILKGSTALLLLTTTTFCSNKQDKNSTPLDTSEILQQVDTVVAIGKVISENGNTLISPNVNGIVKEIFVKDGDSVSKGSILIQLNSNTEAIDVSIAQTKSKSIQNQAQISQSDIEREKISLKNLEQIYKTSKTLFEQQVETKENLQKDESNYLQQKQIVESLVKQYQINQINLQEQQLNIDKSNKNLEDYTILALNNGIITNLNVSIGQYLNSSQSIGEIVDPTKTIIEAEVDELFADKVIKGQEVTFVSINTNQVLGKGSIFYTSPILTNKSILYESANEASDRRVLRIKIKPTSSKNLLINAKVECQIKIK